MTRQKDFDRWMAQDAEIRTLQAENARPEYARFDNRLKRQKAGIVRAIKEGVGQ